MEHKLSDFELEVMNLFWRKGELTTPDIHQTIAERRKTAYTTVKTILDRLEKKGAVARVRQYGRTILYRAAVPESEVAEPLLRRFVDTAFGGNRRRLFSNLLADEKLTMEDISYLQNLLEEKKNVLREEEQDDLSNQSNGD